MTVTIIPAPVGMTLLVEDDDGGGLLEWGTILGFAVTHRETQEGRTLGETLPVTLYGYDSCGDTCVPTFGVLHANGSVESMDGETWDSFSAANEHMKNFQRSIAERKGLVKPEVVQHGVERKHQNQGKAGLLNNAEAAEYLGVAPQTLTIWRCVKRYNIPFAKVGSRVRYRKEDLDTWLASRTVGSVE